MSVKIECDKCGHKESIREPNRIWPVNMYAVSPGNSKEHDRMLCATCYKQYKKLKVELKAGVTINLLNWFEA